MHFILRVLTGLAMSGAVSATAAGAAELSADEASIALFKNNCIPHVIDGEALPRHGLSKVPAAKAAALRLENADGVYSAQVPYVLLENPTEGICRVASYRSHHVEIDAFVDDFFVDNEMFTEVAMPQTQSGFTERRFEGVIAGGQLIGFVAQDPMNNLSMIMLARTEKAAE